MSVDILERMRVAFRSEAQELLSELDSALLTLEADPGQHDLVHRVFRAIHTIKGSGSTAGFTHLAAVAHKVEEAFDLARSGRLPITGELADCGLKACDVLRAILSADDPDAECPGEQVVVEALSRLLPQSVASTESSPKTADGRPATARRMAYEITLRPRKDLFYSGTDPVTLLDELRGLGQAQITAHTDRIPLFFDFDPESCFLWWDIVLVTESAEAAVREVFSFVEEECEVSIQLTEDQSSAVALLGTIGAESLELFLVECQEHLETLESYTLELEGSRMSRESLDALFRAVHSVKGNAGLLLGQVAGTTMPSLPTAHPLQLLAKMAHAVESTLDSYRHDGRVVPAETVATVLEAKDAMQGLLEDLRGHVTRVELPAALTATLGLETPIAAHPMANATAFANTAGQCIDLFEGCLEKLAQGDTSTSVLKTYQRGLKTLASAAVHQKRSDLEEPVAKQLRILEAAMQASTPLTNEDLSFLKDSFESARSRIADNFRVEEAKAVAAPIAPAPAAVSGKAAPAVAGSAGTIRIDQEKLDRLMRVVGELLIARGTIPALAEKVSAGEDRGVITRSLKEAGSSISRIAEELQASVMAIRMLPVKTVFQRFPRLVRDLARTLGKEVQLFVEGDSIELDKTILEQIGDPLVHLVRNSLDHGLERPEDRSRAGKNRQGRITLRASNEAGNVVIEVEDDGRGLDAEALKRKALQNRLITQEAAAAMSPAEAYQLIFLPGLSTAEKVTDVSGRGVGMDVVKNNIRALQGTIDISSKPGIGTVISIKLPTSLIVSKGILLEAGGQEYILPLTSIRDMVKMPASNLHVYQGMRLTQVRGEVYSVFSIAELFGLPVKRSDEVSIAVVQAGKAGYCLLADRFVSEVEVLVKPLAGGLENCREFHGAAIMNDGRVVLVLNAQECHKLEEDLDLETAGTR